ncbi:MAG: hypothetical protein V3T83_12905 [Acidobacteriota bacterium]
MFYHTEEFQNCGSKPLPKYDVVVIGSGPAGFSLAMQFLEGQGQTMKVAMLESSALGYQEAQARQVSCSFDVENLYRGQLVGWAEQNGPIT